MLIPIKKKTNASRCEEWRTTSLLTHASYVLLRVLTRRGYRQRRKQTDASRRVSSGLGREGNERCHRSPKNDD